MISWEFVFFAWKVAGSVLVAMAPIGLIVFAISWLLDKWDKK